MMKHIKDLLAETNFFDNMDEEYLELLAGCGILVHFKPGEYLAKEGEEANNFYLILKGDVSIESKIPNGILTVGKADEEDVVGYSWLFPPFRNAFDARALNHVRAIKLDGKCLRGKAEDDHKLGYEFMKRFAQLVLERMQATRRQMIDIYGSSEKGVG